jgi:hypothetical protein
LNGESLTPRFVERWKEDTNQDGDYSNDNEELDEGETSAFVETGILK